MTTEQILGLLVAAANRDELAAASLADFIKERGHELEGERVKALFGLVGAIEGDYLSASETMNVDGIDHAFYSIDEHEPESVTRQWITKCYLEHVKLPLPELDFCDLCDWLEENCECETCNVCGEKIDGLEQCGCTECEVCHARPDINGDCECEEYGAENTATPESEQSI
jgi:hypothetical protein